jgi:hypothetical protein
MSDIPYLRGLLSGFFKDLDKDGRKELLKAVRGMTNSEIGTIFLQELKKYD